MMVTVYDFVCNDCGKSLELDEMVGHAKLTGHRYMKYIGMVDGDEGKANADDRSS